MRGISGRSKVRTLIPHDDAFSNRTFAQNSEDHVNTTGQARIQPCDEEARGRHHRQPRPSPRCVRCRLCLSPRRVVPSQAFTRSPHSHRRYRHLGARVLPAAQDRQARCTCFFPSDAATRAFSSLVLRFAALEGRSERQQLQGGREATDRGDPVLLTTAGSPRGLPCEYEGELE